MHIRIILELFEKYKCPGIAFFPPELQICFWWAALFKNNWTLWWSFQRRQWHPTPVLLPGKSHGWRSLVGCSPWSLEESDTTEQLHFHFSLSCIGEGNGNPLQCSCRENPRDGGAWWSAIYGVAQSRTRLKWLGSSSRMMIFYLVCFTFSISYSVLPFHLVYVFWFLHLFLFFLFLMFFIKCSRKALLYIYNMYNIYILETLWIFA